MLSEWRKYTLGELFDFYGGMSFSRANLGDQGILYLHYGDIHKTNKLEFNTDTDKWIPRINKEVGSVKKDALLNTGDIVFADASEDYDGIGKSIVIKNDDNLPFLSGLHTIVAKDKEKFNLVNIGFKKYFLSTSEVRNQFRILATGISVYGISRANLPKVEVVLPPLPEQQKIADILSSVDEVISKTEAIIEQTEKVKKGLMQELLTKGIGHTKFKQTEIGEIPEEWTAKRISDLVSFSGGAQPPRSAFKFKYEEGLIRLIQIRDYKTDKYATFIPKELAKKTCSLTDVMIGRYGPPIFQILRGIEGAYNVALIKAIPDEGLLLKDYLFYYLQQDKLFKLIDGLSQRTSGQTGIDMDVLKSYEFPLPPLSEQQRIVNVIQSIEIKINKEQQKLTQLQTLKKGLMQDLLTGKVRVKLDN